MNIQNISIIIRDLLQTNECVTIPGFGAFVVNPSSASVDMAKNRFTPPGKKVSFNKNIVNNDGLLSSALASKEGISYEDAVLYLKGVSEQIQKELQDQKVFDFFEIGTFFWTKENLLKFEPRELETADGLGLEPFHLTPISDSPFIGKEAISVHKSNVQKEIQYIERTGTWGKVGWGLAILPVIVYLAWVPSGSGVLDKNKSFQFSNLNPFRETPCEEYVARPAGLSSFDLSTTDILWPDFDEAKMKFAVPETTNVVIETPKEIIAHQYQIIGGCFGKQSNAKRLVRKLNVQGYPASILDKKNGLYRVTYGGYGSQSEARIALKNVKANTNASAWLLKEK